MISIKAAGGYDQLAFEELQDNKPTTGANFKSPTEKSVTINVHASGVNYADVGIRWGLDKTAKDTVGWPITPGFDFSGMVSAVGSEVDKFKVGDIVFGLTIFGGYTEKVIVPENQLFHLPKSFSLSEGAGFMTVTITAWYAIVECCRLRPGDKILVHSATGGVGSMLVQMGKILQCYVVGVVGSSHKTEIALSLGCDVVIDKSKEDLWQKANEYSEGAGYKAVFDANGVETLRKSFESTTAGGRLVVYGFQSMLPRSNKAGTGTISLWQWLRVGVNYMKIPQFSPMEMIESNKSVMCFTLNCMFENTALFHEAMDQIVGWIESGKLKPLKVTEYPLSDAAAAHRDLESGLTTGKLVLLSRSAWKQKSNQEGDSSVLN